MATAKMVIGTLPGVDRPALAAMIPTKAAKPVLLLDVGANSECKAHHLAQFADHGRRLFAGGAGNSKAFGRFDEHWRRRGKRKRPDERSVSVVASN